MNMTLRKAVIIVALLNLAYFGVESHGLLAPSVPVLVVRRQRGFSGRRLGQFAHRRSARLESVIGSLGVVLAGILCPRPRDAVDGVGEFMAPLGDILSLSLTGAGRRWPSICRGRIMLARFRAHSGSLTRAAFLVGAQRRSGKRCNHRGRHCDGRHALRAGLIWSLVWHRGTQRRCCAASLEGCTVKGIQPPKRPAAPARGLDDLAARDLIAHLSARTRQR